MKMCDNYPNCILRVMSFLAAILAAPMVLHAATCAEFEKQVVESVRENDAERAAQAFELAEKSRTCGGEALSLLGRHTATAHYAAAFKPELREDERDRVLRRALTFGRPWQALAAMADIEKSAKHYSEAATLYQEALDDIRDERLNPQSPPEEVIASLIKKAEETRLLAPDYVKRVDRDGSPSGLACPIFRGFAVRRTSLPVEFEYDSTTFTEKGRKAVEDLQNFLTQQGEVPIRLIGHTDPRGADTYNLTLSERRANAVKSFLAAKGYKAKIETVGKGRAEPFQSDDPDGYTAEERWQLDRRVELDREGAKACSSPSR